MGWVELLRDAGTGWKALNIAAGTGWCQLGVSGFENLLGYTEVDPNSHIGVTSARATGTSIAQDEDAYIYKSMGANYFDALAIDFVINWTSQNYSECTVGLLCLANAVNDITGHGATDFHVQVREDNTKYRLCLVRGSGTSTSGYDISENTSYYCTLSRVIGSDTVTLKIYSDESRSDLLNTQNVVGFGTAKWQYIYALCSYNAGNSRYQSVYCENIMIN